MCQRFVKTVTATQNVPAGSLDVYFNLDGLPDRLWQITAQDIDCMLLSIIDSSVN